jgi:phosphopantetheinyl transferase
MGQIRFYGPEPPAGTALECMLRIRSITEHELIADAQLTRGGQVWAELDGWVDRRFDSHPETRAVERFPEHNTLSRRQQRDWVLLYERWPDLASRDLIMRNHLGGDERAEGERQPPRARRQRLLGRIAVKDAVRHQLWDAGAGAVFPAEIAVSNDAAGRPGVRGVHGRAIGEFDVSVAHCAEVGVAIARRRPPGLSSGVGLSGGVGFSGGVGIDVEEVAERSAATVHFALSEPENDVLARACADTGEPERLWFTRFWTAKEAVAKAEGTGLAGRPRQFAVVAAEPTGLVVEVGEHAYRVEFAEVSNPDDLPDRQYVVAWTTGHRTEQDHDGTQEADA